MSLKYPRCEDRAFCCTNPDIGGLVAPSDCIECKQEKKRIKKVMEETKTNPSIKYQVTEK